MPEQTPETIIDGMAKVMIEERWAVSLETPVGCSLRPGFEKRLRDAGFGDVDVAAYYDLAIARAAERSSAAAAASPAGAETEAIAQVAPAPPQAEPLLPPGFQWACVEVFGHRRHFGRCTEEERFGAKMLRVDVPKPASDGPSAVAWTTHYYGGGALFSYTLPDEETVMSRNRPYVSPYPRRIAPPELPASEDDNGDEVLESVDHAGVDDDRPF